MILFQAHVRQLFEKLTVTQMEDPLLSWARVELDNIPNSQEVGKPSSQFHPHFILTPISPQTFIPPKTWGYQPDHRIKGTTVRSHFGKSRVRHETTRYLNEVIFQNRLQLTSFKILSRSMSDPTLSEIVFKMESLESGLPLIL